jgi:hypothetical protein
MTSKPNRFESATAVWVGLLLGRFDSLSGRHAAVLEHALEASGREDAERPRAFGLHFEGLRHAPRLPDPGNHYSFSGPKRPTATNSTSAPSTTLLPRRLVRHNASLGLRARVSQLSGPRPQAPGTRLPPEPPAAAPRPDDLRPRPDPPLANPGLTTVTDPDQGEPMPALRPFPPPPAPWRSPALACTTSCGARARSWCS